MIPGCRRVGGQEENAGQFVVEMEVGRGEIQYGGDEHQAVEVHAVPLLQISRKTRRARGAVGFARQEFGREPAVIAGDVQADEVADGFDVLLEGVPVLRLLAFHGTAVACAHRVDENEVGVVEDGILVVGQLERGRREFAFVGEDDATGSQHAHVQPHRRGAWSAVEGEGDGTFGFVPHAVLGVGDEEDLGAGLLDLGVLLLIGDLFLEDHRPRGDGVLDLLPADLDRVLAFDKVILGGGLFFFFLFGFFGHGISPKLDGCSDLIVIPNRKSSIFLGEFCLIINLLSGEKTINQMTKIIQG